jgi:integrase
MVFSAMSPARSRHNGEGSIYPCSHGFGAYAWITTPDGRRQRKYVYGKSREDVHKKWLELLRSAQNGPVVSKSPTLAQYMSGWLSEVVEPNLAPSTVSNYAMFVRLYIAPDLGLRKLDKLTVRDVQAWMNVLRTRCQCCFQGKDAARDKPKCCAVGECCHQVASEWTRHQAWTVLRAALASAVRDELVPRNVAVLVRVPVPRQRRTVMWSVEESRRFLESARADGDPYYAGYVLMLVLGLRRGEVLGLAWEDVDLDARELHVSWQLQRIGGRLLRRETKTASSDAALPLPDISVRALEVRLGDRADQVAVAGELWHESGLVLTTPLGMPVDPRNFHRAFKERATKAGVPVTSVHATRRACASLLVALDVHPRVAMQILRHSQIAVTMDVYSQVSSAATVEALKRLGQELTGPLGD